MTTLAIFGWGTSEFVLIGIIAVLLFGRRLPEVGKNLGKSLMAFKHGLKGTADELTDVDEAVDEVNKAMQQQPEQEQAKAKASETTPSEQAKASETTPPDQAKASETTPPDQGQG